MLQQTKPHRRRRRESLVVLDDTLCEHVGSLFEHVDRHYNHGDGTYPLAHNPVTSFYVSGPVCFPLGLGLDRRYEELTQWEACVAKHVPERKILTDQKARNRLHQQVDPVLLQEAEFRARHEPFGPKLLWPSPWWKRPFGPKCPLAWWCSTPGTWPRSWSKSWPVDAKDWMSLLKTLCRAGDEPADWSAAQIIAVYWQRWTTEIV